MFDDDRQQKKALDKQKEWDRTDKLERDDALRALLQHRNGRRLVFWLLEISKAVGVNPFSGNALSTAFNCGEQNVGQQIMGQILEVDPDGFLQVLKERENERAERNRLLADL